MAIINGDLEDNVIIGTDDGDSIYGDDGNDVIRGGKGNDDLRGGAGDDVITGGAGDDVIHGGGGSDTVSFIYTSGPTLVDLAAGYANGAAGFDRLNSIENIVGSDYYDDLYGDENANVISGGGGIDYLFGRLGDDSLYGGDDTDLLVGDLGNDVMDGGRGRDFIYGGDGNDIITGGAGGDYLNGGEKVDTFVYTVATQSSYGNMDTIADFKDGKDIIDLSAIDAKTGSGLNDAFELVESFSGNAGELVITYNESTNRTIVAADTDGDGEADFGIMLKGFHSGVEGWVL
jgi:Ca2+-binding RTX toxin-like protein